MRNIIYIGFVLALLFCGCKKEEKTEPAAMGYEFFPVNPSHYVIYQVDSISWTDWNGVTGNIDTFRYQIMERAESVFYDAQNRPAVRIERYKRNQSSAGWQIKDVWFANVTASRAERVEENLRFIKMIFPVKNNLRWDGNALNVLEEQEYYYSDFGTPFTAGNLSFDTTVTVNQIDETSAISRDYAVEIYAKNVGMIYKRVISLETNPLTNGYDCTYTITGWGN